MKVHIGSDQRGYDLKDELSRFLRGLDYEVEDHGCYSRESCDYPVFAEKVSRACVLEEKGRGILICWTGIGMSMAANKIPGIRAALCSNIETARLSRQHNDSNILCLGAKYTSSELAKEIVDVWLETDFSGEERHIRRIGQIADLEHI